MKYHVIEHWDRAVFLELVNRHLAQGWQLVGGVAISDNSVTRWWAQAVVKP